MPTSAEPSVQLVGNLATWPRPSDRSSNSKREKERLVYAVIQKQSSGRWRQIIQVKQIIICIFIFILNKSSSRNHLFLSLICFPLFSFSSHVIQPNKIMGTYSKTKTKNKVVWECFFFFDFVFGSLMMLSFFYSFFSFLLRFLVLDIFPTPILHLFFFWLLSRWIKERKSFILP